MITEKFACWNVLLFQYLKRDLKKIIIWIIALGLFSGGFVPAFEEIAQGQGLVGMYETMQNPAMIAMVGTTPVTDSASYTLAAMYTNEMLLFCALFAMIISALHVISHTRKEEDLGLSELVRSFRVGRHANSLAIVKEIVIINLVLTIFIGLLMSSFQVVEIDLYGSIVFGASIGIAGIMGGLIALVMAQIMSTSAGATGLSLAFIGLLYFIRATTDISNPDLSIFNPVAWTYLTYPYLENDWLPVIFGLFFSILLFLGAVILEGNRDMQTGYLPERTGRAQAKKSLLSIPGLLLRINRGVIIAWLISFLIIGAAYGSIYGDMQSFLESNLLMEQMFTQADYTIEESFTSVITMLMISMVAILPIVIVNKLYSEEVRGHFSQLYATKVSRAQIYWTMIVIALVVGLLAILLSACGLGFSALAVMEQKSTMTIGDFIIIGYNYLPLIIIFTGFSAFLLGIMPRLGKVVYLYLLYSAMLSYFSGILKLPDWFSYTSVNEWLPQLPIEQFNGWIFIIVSLLGLVLIIIGYYGYKNRDFQEGA
ncbi:tetronasin resistance protein [Erysipelotrichaceae bacterium OttesenSCG-928-M19]|nr:tetronasin resistance protein [Erysipelotrichaceae bacterium OttesenSCG-928-M19]